MNTAPLNSAFWETRFVNGKLTREFIPSRFKLHRVAGWRRRLRDVLERYQDEPYMYGQHDCVVIVAHAIEAVTGHVFRFGYQGIEESQNWKKAQGGNLIDAWGTLLGPPVEGAAGAVDGDIGLIGT